MVQQVCMANSVDPSDIAFWGIWSSWVYTDRKGLSVIIVTDYYVLNFVFMHILIMNHLEKLVNINSNDQRECIFMLFNFYI